MAAKAPGSGWSVFYYMKLKKVTLQNASRHHQLCISWLHILWFTANLFLQFVLRAAWLLHYVHSIRCNHTSSTWWLMHTHPFNGPLTGTTQVSRYQKGKTNLDFTEARDGEWQWHQLGHMQVCTSLQTDNHANTSPLSFFTGWLPFLLPNQQRQSTEGRCVNVTAGLVFVTNVFWCVILALLWNSLSPNYNHLTASFPGQPG